MTTAKRQSSSAQDDKPALQDATADVVEQASRTAEAQASKTLVRAGDTLDQVAKAVRDAGEGLREQQPQLADLATTAADQVYKASGYLRAHDARELLQTTESFARRQPIVVVGGALIAGLAIGRLLKSSATPAESRGSGGSSASRGYGFRGYESHWGGSDGGGFVGVGPGGPGAAQPMAGVGTRESAGAYSGKTYGAGDAG